MILLLACAFTGCKDEYEPRPSNNCDDTAIVSEQQFENASRDPLTVNSLEIDDDCLKINYTASGCNGDDWVIKLISDEVIMESLPPQRAVVFSFENDEPCDALVTKETSFDISPLRVSSNSVILRISNNDGRLLYEYDQ